MLKFFLSCLAFCGLFSVGFAQNDFSAQYPLVSTMKDVEKITMSLLEQYHAQDIFFVSDIDETLVMSMEPATHGQNRHQYNMRDYVKSLSKETFIVMLNLSHFKESTTLVDVDAPDVIKRLQERGIKTIACTASATGSFGPLTERMEVFRAQTLRNHGIDFSSTFPEIRDRTFETITGNLGRSPAFYEGILCSCGFANDPMKGVALIELLKAAHYTPKVIVFVDDKELYLKDVEKAFATYMPTVKFVGIHFKGTYQRHAQPISKEDFWTFWKTLEREASDFLAQNKKDLNA